MKKIRISKFDLIIYGCLVGVCVCLGIAVKDYYLSLNEDGLVNSDTDYAMKKVEGVEEGEEELIIDLEPVSLKEYDKKQIVVSYFESILDQIINDNVVSYEILKTWSSYDILEFRYVKEITDNYYMYEVDIKINNKDAELPKAISGDFSNDEYNVITLNIYIFEYIKDSSYKVKKVEV